jgi:TolB-like protein
VFEVNFLDRELRKNGIRVKLPEKPLQILEALLEKAGDMVRRENLRVKLWPHTHVDFDRSINTAVNQLRRALDDPANDPHFIETRYRLGYRFVAPVRTWNEAEPPARKVGATIDTIAVLPFDSSSGDSEIQLLSDSITQNIVTCLSQVVGVRVIGSSCVFRYRGPEIDPPAVGCDLRTRAVLTGWITRRCDSVTIGTELVDVARGWRLWGEQYDFKVSNTWPIMTEILKTICHKVRQGLTEADTRSHEYFATPLAHLDGFVDSLRLSAQERTLETAVKRRILQDND